MTLRCILQLHTVLMKGLPFTPAPPSLVLLLPWLGWNPPWPGPSSPCLFSHFYTTYFRLFWLFPSFTYSDSVVSPADLSTHLHPQLLHPIAGSTQFFPVLVSGLHTFLFWENEQLHSELHLLCRLLSLSCLWPRPLNYSYPQASLALLTSLGQGIISCELLQVLLPETSAY